MDEDRIHRGRSRGYAVFLKFFSRLSYCLFSGGGNFSQMLLELGTIDSSARILDIGCGVGNLLIEITKNAPGFSGKTVVGADYSHAMLKVASGKFSTNLSKPYFVECDIASLPFQDGSFGVCFNVLLLHHLPRELKVRAMNEINRILADGGICVLMDIDKPTTFLGKAIAFLRRTVVTIRQNTEYGLEYFFTQSGFISDAHFRKLGIFSYYRLVKRNKL
jgi:ubiquinone/menaquinone biosynthesis C-methylase UbiE